LSPKKSPTSITGLVSKTSKLLNAQWRDSGLTQKEFASSISESRSMVSHLLNCTKPETKNPVVPDVKSVIRVLDKLIKAKEPVSGAITKDQARQRLHEAIDAYVELCVGQKDVIESAVPERIVVPKPKVPKLKPKQVWRNKRHTRSATKVVVVGVHNKQDADHSIITVRNVKTLRQSVSKQKGFLKNYTYVGLKDK
jgi:hypothetical protein